jgi:hypothetical protein
MNNTCGDGFHTEAGDGSERETSHGWFGEMAGELIQRKSVDALASGGEGADGELMRGGASGGDKENFGVRVGSKKSRGAI